MSRYVLEILDGDQAGVSIPLTEAKLSIGRKPDNGLVLGDEKCSGHHAEIEFEDGAYVLRDLGSTNGSLIDGCKITEVALSNFDVFQVGRVNIRFQVKGATDPAADMQVSRINQSALPARRGSSVRNVILVVMLIVACGALAWLQFFAPKGSGLGGPIIRLALAVPGNRLVADVANLEGDVGWDLQAGGGGFEPAFGRRAAHTGSGCIEVRRGDEGPSYALARTSEVVSVLAGTVVRLRAHLRTEGGARMAIRARFSSSSDDLTLCSGSVPASYPDYQAVDFVAGVPQGMDQLAVEILAVLPEPGEAAFADDIAVLTEPSQAQVSLEMSSRDGRFLRGIGSSFLVRGPLPTLLGVRPLVATGDYAELASDGLLVPSDLGMRLEVTALEPSGFHLLFTQASGMPAIEGLSLRFPGESRPAAIAAEGAAFASQASEFTALEGTEILIGHGGSRCLLRFATAVTIDGHLGLAGYDLDLRGETEFELHLVMDAYARQARDLLREARSSIEVGEMHLALDSLAVLRRQFPHDETVMRSAEEARRELLAAMSRRVAELREDASEALFFHSRKGFRRVHEGIATLLSTYGSTHIPQAETLGQLSKAMRDGMQLIAARDQAEHAERLQLLEEAFRSSAQPDLADLLRDYLQRSGHDPKTGQGR